MNKIVNLKYFALVLILSLFSVRALFHPGLPPTHDGEYHVVRFYEFFNAFLSGAIYPRWAEDLNFGMGAPLLNFVYPLPNYFSLVLHFFGLSFIDLFKLNLIAATVTGAFSMYFFSRLYFKEIGGVVSSVFYTFAPYRFLDVFIRGSVGEVWALSFFPAFLWGVTKLSREGKMVYVGLSGLFLALIVFSHNILALMFFLFSIFYVGLLFLSSKEKRSYFIKILFSFALGLGLSAIFWLPALIEKKFVRGLDIFELRENFPEIYQLLIPSWGSGFSGGSISGQMSFQIGLANLFVVFLSLILLLRSRKAMKSKIIFFIISFFVIFFLITKSSTFLWEHVPLLYYFQFPWRLLSLEIFISAFLAGFIWREILNLKLRGRFKTIFLCGLLLTPVLTTMNYAKPAYYHQRSDNYYISRPNFISGTNSPGNAFNTIWAGKIEKMNGFKIVKGEGRISVYKKSATNYEVRSSSSERLTILANIMYFPGWTLYTDGRRGEATPNPDGQIQFNLSQGEHASILKLMSTKIQLIGFFISIVSMGFLAILLLKNNYTIIKR